MNDARILISSSDRLTRRSLYETLFRFGYKADVAGSAKQSISHLENKTYHAVLADLDVSSGVELLKTIKKHSYRIEVIALTSSKYGETIFKEMNLGSACLMKPIEDDVIIDYLRKAIANRMDTPEIPASIKIQANEEKGENFYGLLGDSPEMKEIYRLIERISDSKATVFLRGESGTGKRVIARAIHSADKKRRYEPFIEIPCGALPRDIIESELFGHTKGAFTGAINDRKGRFELAHGGTVLLDDIDCLPLDLQVKLLRVLQQREFEKVGDHKTIKVDVRIIASTNQDPEKAVAEKRFREDLYYRLNVISVHIPPLRERKSDLPSLVEHFIKVYSHDNNKAIKSLSSGVLQILQNHNWPGNIRELENIIERAVILDRDGVIGADDLPKLLLAGSAPLKNRLEINAEAETSSSLKNALQESEKIYMLKILQEVGWNKKKAAVNLGVNRTTLYNKLRKYNLILESTKE